MKHIITLIIVTFILNLNGQTFHPDASFGTNGIKKIPVDAEVDQLEFLDIDTNSFLVFSKIYFPDDSRGNLVFKVKTDGTLDATFGTNGQLSLPNYSGELYLYKQGTKFIVYINRVFPSSTADNERAILRYNPDGSLDTTFGINGEVRIDKGSIGGTGISNIVLQNDQSILFSDPQKFIKYSIDGVIDTTYGTNGTLTVASIGNMSSSNNEHILFHNSLRIEKMDYNGNLINTFGDDGSYSFPNQDDYLVKSSTDRISFMQLGDGSSTFYDLNNDGTPNNSFSTNGNVDLTTDNGTLLFYDNFLFDKGIFYFVGETIDEIPFIVCYNDKGDLIPINNADSYKETLVPSAYFSSILTKGDYLYICGDSYDEITNQWSFIIAKYTTPSLSIESIAIQNKIAFNNPIGDELKVNSQDKIISIELFNLTGQKVQTSDSNTVNTSYLHKGIYIVQVEFKNGTIAMAKLLKE